MDSSARDAYKYRIGFGAWINDMRPTPLPLEGWPAPQFDDETVDGIIRTMDVQQAAGYNMLDVWGMFATYGWPPDITSAMDEPRRKNILRLLKEAASRDIQLVLGLGTYSWGYDQIIAADPDVCGKDASGAPHPHAMCDASPKAFEYVKRIIDFALGEFDFPGVHLESCDLGCCECPECAGGRGRVDYNVGINIKAADYIKSQWPEKTVYVITISWIPALTYFSAAEMDSVVELGRHVDCIFDQGHHGFQVPSDQRRDFISRLDCAYGTSGQMWMYPDARWDRDSFFIPYPKRDVEALNRQFADGVRGCMHYLGPVTSTSTEVNIAVGGRALSNPHREVSDVLGEVLDLYYRPRTETARKALAEVWRIGEDSYFDNWVDERFRTGHGIPMPGEWMLDADLFNTTPGPATYLKEPFLDPDGRKVYKQGLIDMLKLLPDAKGQCDDDGRVARIERSLIVTMQLLNTVMSCKGES